METLGPDPLAAAPSTSFGNEALGKKRSGLHGPHRKTRHKVNTHHSRLARAAYLGSAKSTPEDSSADGLDRPPLRYPWHESYKQRYPITRPTPFEEKYPRDR